MRAGGDVALVDKVGVLQLPAIPDTFRGTLVVDRLVVVPGQSLKVTGGARGWGGGGQGRGAAMGPSAWVACGRAMRSGSDRCR